jgi:hypothetical protein
MKNSILSILLGLTLVGFYSCQAKKTDSQEVVSNTLEETDSEEGRPSPLEVKEGMIGSKSIKVQYSSPAVKGRTIWGDLVPYNVVWRTGANEATFLDIPETITVEGKTLGPGKYSLFTIPKESGNWTVIFNSDWDLEHGHFQYDEKKDVLRVEVAPVWENTPTERLTINVESPGLIIYWEKLKLPITIQ